MLTKKECVNKRMKKIDRRVRKTRKSIKTALAELIQKKPLSSITITELTKKADIDRRTFYLHYSNIDEIVEDIENDAVQTLQEAVPNKDRFNIESFFNGLTSIMTSNIDFYRTITTNPIYYRFVFQCKEILKTSLKDSFAGKTSLSPDDFDFNCEYIASGIMGVYINWFVTDSRMPIDQLTKKAEKVFSESWQIIIK